ncbi:MAG: DNA polymerase III subunit chi [Gammaproteobacteria bacterium]|nr:DNA polymerase III subunit chi [Gammaproteobacteria bacterium]
MTRIDFYVLPELRLDAREHFAARLAAKAFRQGQRSLIQVADDASVERLSTLLWEQPRNAFLGHARLGAPGVDQRAPVVLAAGSELAQLDPASLPVHDLLINLELEVPARFAAFDRVAEIICQDEKVRDAGRVSYRFYRERGYPLHHHDLARRQASGPT